jgi:fucose permease
LIVFVGLGFLLGFGGGFWFCLVIGRFLGGLFLEDVVGAVARGAISFGLAVSFILSTIFQSFVELFVEGGGDEEVFF